MERDVAPCLCGLAAPFSILRESVNTAIQIKSSPLDPSTRYRRQPRAPISASRRKRPYDYISCTFGRNRTAG
jgi:hypothetical protein